MARRKQPPEGGNPQNDLPLEAGPTKLPAPPPDRAFGGETYEPVRDYQRLRGQLLNVYTVMLDGKPHTLSELSEQCKGSEASVSARIRDLRKEAYGAHNVIRENLGGGRHTYRLALP